MRPFILIMLSFLVGCTGIPEGITPITGFELSRYLGTWYEIARLDHRFERGLTEIRAEYSLRDDGGIKVLNSGYDPEQKQRRTAEGKGYFVDSKDTGRLQVSFFGPFYGAYNIIALDKADYRWVMICGPDRDYLWILSRTPTLEPSVLKTLIAEAKNRGFATEQLIFSQQQVVDDPSD